MPSFEERLKAYNNEKFFGQWRLAGATPSDALLGRGTYGVVYRICREERDTRGHVNHYTSALKIIRIEPEVIFRNRSIEALGEAKVNKGLRAALDGAENEIKTMKQLEGNSNIAYFQNSEIKEYTEGKWRCWDVLIRMEELITLRQFLRQSKLIYGTRPYIMCVLHIWKDIGEALRLCENNSILHLDVKPDNIFYAPGPDCFKLGDFGVAERTKQRAPGRSPIGTRVYMAPEVYHSIGADNRADLYSLAVMIYELFNNGLLPFQQAATANREGVEKFRLGEQRAVVPTPPKGLAQNVNDMLALCPKIPPIKGLPPQINALLLKCLQVDPDKRFANINEFKQEIVALEVDLMRSKTIGVQGAAGKRKIIIACAGTILLGMLMAAVWTTRPPARQVSAPVQGATSTPSATSIPSATPTPSATPKVSLQLALETLTVEAGVGEAAISGTVVTQGEIPEDALVLRIAGNAVAAQDVAWNVVKNGYAFTAQVNREWEAGETVQVSVSMKGDAAVAAQANLEVAAPAATGTPDATAAATGTPASASNAPKATATPRTTATGTPKVTATPVPTVTVTPTAIPVKTQAPEITLTLDGSQVMAGVGAFTLEGRVRIAGAIQPEQLEVRIGNELIPAQSITWTEVEDGYCFAVTLDRERDANERLGVEIAYTGNNQIAASAALIVDAPAGICVDNLDQLSAPFGGDATIPLSITAEPGLQVACRLAENMVVGTYTVGEDGALTINIDADQLLDGENTLTLLYTNIDQASGNTPVEVCVQIDRTPPEMQGTTPEILDQHTGEMDVLLAPEDALSTVALWVDGMHSGVEATADSEGKARLTGLETLELHSGSNVEIVVTDLAGNESRETVPYQLSVASLSLTVVPETGGMQTVFTVSGTAEPNAELKLSYGNGGELTLNAGADGAYSGTLDASALQTGSNEVNVAYVRVAGETVQGLAGASAQLQYDGEAPEVQMTTQRLIQGQRSITAQISETGTWTAELLIDGTAVAETSGAGEGACELLLPEEQQLLPESRIALRVTDAAGNATTDESVHYAPIMPISIENAEELATGIQSPSDTLALQLRGEPGAVLTIQVSGGEQAREMQITLDASGYGDCLLKDLLASNTTNEITVTYSLANADYTPQACAQQETVSVYYDGDAPELSLQPASFTRDDSELVVTVSNEPKGYSVFVRAVDASGALLTDRAGNALMERQLADHVLESAYTIPLTEIAKLLEDGQGICLTVTDPVGQSSEITAVYHNVSTQLDAYAASEITDFGVVHQGESAQASITVLCSSIDMMDGYVYLQLADDTGEPVQKIKISPQRDVEQLEAADFAAEMAKATGQLDQAYVNAGYRIVQVPIDATCPTGDFTLELCVETEFSEQEAGGAPRTFSLGSITIEAMQLPTSSSVSAPYVDAQASYAVGLDDPIQEQFRSENIVLTGWVRSSEMAYFNRYDIYQAGTGIFLTGDNFITTENINRYSRADVTGEARELAGEDLTTEGFVISLDLSALRLASGDVIEIQLSTGNGEEVIKNALCATVVVDAAAPEISDGRINAITAAWQPVIAPEE